jgi:hypothetical protein
VSARSGPSVEGEAEGTPVQETNQARGDVKNVMLHAVGHGCTRCSALRNKDGNARRVNAVSRAGKRWTSITPRADPNHAVDYDPVSPPC